MSRRHLPPVLGLACLGAFAGLAACDDGAEPEDAAPPADASAAPAADAVDADLGPGAPGDADVCATLSAEARAVTRPVDVILVVDNSGSMTEEIEAVQANINRSFAAIIGASGLDYRVILVSRHGSARAEQSICISAPLAGNASCSPPPPTPTFGPRFFQYDVEIGSRDSFEKLLDTYARPDALGLAPRGWSAWVRPEAVKVFIEITDDSEEAISADVFDQRLRALAPDQFEAGGERSYVFHAIVGLRENAPASSPWLPTDPLQAEVCTRGGGAESPGAEYQKLARLTGGLRWPICEHGSFDAVFQRAAAGVVDRARVPCAFALPEAPAGQVVGAVAVTYASGTGAARPLREVADASACAPDAFYIDAGELRLCPRLCAVVEADDAARLSARVSCDPRIW